MPDHHRPTRTTRPPRRQLAKRQPELGLGFRFYRRWVLVRRPVYIAINLARHPSLTIRLARGTLNVNPQGLAVRVAPAPGWAYRRQLLRWPWTRARPNSDQDADE
jgi:hypothetical protein